MMDMQRSSVVNSLWEYIMLRRFFLLLTLVALLTTAACSGETAQTTTDSLTSQMVELPDFLRDEPVRVREAYQFAAMHPDALETVPCYCGCGSMGHTSNLSCYIGEMDEAGGITYDNHAAGCGICVDITQDVMRMTNEGKSAKEIRAAIDAQYSAFGPSTNTPLPS